MTTPDGTIYKEFFHTSGWASGLTHTSEVWSGGVKKKWTTVSYTQDDINLSYKKNPRVTETNVYDEAGNRRRIVIESTATYAQWGLPYCIHEYAADATTELKRTYYDYDLSQTYLDRRIIGLVSVIHVTNVGSFQSKVFYTYDDPARLEAVPAGATQHDTNYSASFTARGNVTSVSRWDVTDITNASKKLTTYTSYYTTGTPISSTDPSGHTSTMLYADSFSDIGNQNTFAYPTTVTDADSFSSTVKYDYDFGAVTRTQNPLGAVTAITYDGSTRIDRVTNETSGAYTQYAYAPVGSVATYSTIQNGAGEAYQITYFDGAGRVRATAGDHPGSSGLYAGAFTSYDVMGRVSEQTNPGELNSSWVPAGDDVAGLPSTLQTYDWKGRPLLTTSPGGSTRENTYGGCGCAGGEQTTTRDERGRRHRFTKDVFGRLSKVEELNWDQSVYATTNYTYNVRDQITEMNQSGQLRTFEYDGYGRLQTRTTPEQGATNYTYFANGMTKTVTDAREATTTFAYNNRDLVISITYGVPSGVAATPNVGFGYDSAGNRTSMTDGLGSVSYVYNTLSQLTSETRTFTGVAGAFALTYGYNLAGQLNSITNPWGAQVGYGYDKIGRTTNVSGAGYSGLSSYVNSLTYRAFGLKQLAYNNGKTLSVQYDNRMRPTQWNIPGVMGWNYSYQYMNENSGRLMYAQNINDGTLDRSYDYDQVGRLVTAHSGAEARAHMGIGPSGVVDGPYAQQYNYDVWGNITSRAGWGGDNANFTATYTNNKRNGLNYSPAGQLLFDGGHTMTYDATGQQATATFPGYLLEHFYDGNGLRVKKNDAGSVTLYLRSSVLGGQVVAEMSSTGAWQRGYVYLGSELLAIQQSGVYWVHQDPGVKSKRVTNSSGNVVSTVELDPWGGNTNRNNSDIFQPRRFNTYERDLNAADDAVFRRYNRWWSRFDQPDPYGGSYNMANPQSFNRYAYTLNDPVNYVDPLGLDPEEGGGLGAWLGAVAGMGPGTVSVDVPIDGGFGGGLGSGSGGGGEVTMALYPLGRPIFERAPAGTENQELNFLDELKICVNQIYNVALTSFTAANGDRSGSFLGTGFDRYARKNGSILILTNASSFSGRQLADMNNDYARRYPDKRQAMVRPGDVVGGATFSFGTAGLIQVSPYVNYIANDFDRTAKGLNLTSQMSSLFRQVHELGHSLSDITGKGDGERGDQLTNCVFGSLRF